MPSDDLRTHVEALHRAVEPGLRPPDFATIRTRYDRRRRRRQATVMTGGTLALVAVGAFAVNLRTPARDPDTALVVSETAPPPTGDFFARDLAFVDRLNGWALGSYCSQDTCRVGVSRTADGGDTWGRVHDVSGLVSREALTDGTSPGSGAARSVRFVDGHHGFAFNPALYATTDGGATWQSVPVPGQVVALNVTADVWLATRACPSDERQPRCTLRVLAAGIGSARFGEIPTQPPVVGDSALLRRAGGAAWVLSYGPNREQRLVRSADGGASWTELDPPCEEFDRQHLSAATPTVLWLVCTEGTGRTTAKTVYVSTDAGATWDRRGTPADPGETNDLDAVDADTAYLSSSHGDLLVSRDGGRTWRTAAGDGGYINLEFVDPDAGWFRGPNRTLWRWRDGRAERIDPPR